MSFERFGKTQINLNVLKGLKLEEAYKELHYIDKRIVKQAWEVANPKGKNK